MSEYKKPDPEDLGAWFASERKARYLTQGDVADLLGVSKSNVSQLEIRGMSYRGARARAEKLGWDLPSEQAVSASIGTSDVVISSLPACAGQGHNVDAETLTSLTLPKAWLRQNYPGSGNLHSLALCQVQGDSMEPTLKDRDTVLVDTSYREFQGEGVYVVTVGGQLLVKRVVPEIDGGVTLLADNDFYPPRTVTQDQLDQLQVQARVMGVWVGFQSLNARA